ncbi:hypothetical protein [Zavarzinella formosa]|uniref:hypothetical protein n=1 Tax=Zavarzinella formosa TaxID=360055 RepID=UPI000305451D|nr:hypothetical protein [Zavarzinella formosa]
MSTKQKSRHRWVRIIILAILVGLFIYVLWPGKITHTVSPETTYATSPLDADGFVDNVVALNMRLREDISPEQNANVLIWQAIGPRPEGRAMPEQYFLWLGCAAPPDEGEYLIPWTQFISMKTAADKNALPFDRQFENNHRERARQWPWKAADEPDLAEWVAKNARPLALLTQASTRPAYYNPVMPLPSPTGGNGLLMEEFSPNLWMSREMASLLVCRAMMRLGAGNPDDAWRDLMICHRLGLLVATGGRPGEYSAGVLIQTIAIHGELVLLSQGKLSAAQLAACRADLRQLPPLVPVADRHGLNERFQALDVVQTLIRKGPDVASDLVGLPPGDDAGIGRQFSRNVNWDTAMRIINTWCDLLISIMRIDDFQLRDQALKELESNFKAMADEASEEGKHGMGIGAKRRGKHYGVRLVAMMILGTALISDVEIRADQQSRNLTVACALEAHRAEHGAYPARLADLAPKHLPEIPNDAYTNSELKYQRTPTGYLLHSVGPNRIDDGGRDKNAIPPGDDLAIEMPVKEPPPMKNMEKEKK